MPPSCTSSSRQMIAEANQYSRANFTEKSGKMPVKNLVEKDIMRLFQSTFAIFQEKSQRCSLVMKGVCFHGKGQNEEGNFKRLEQIYT